MATTQQESAASAAAASTLAKSRWERLDTSAKALLTLAAFAAVVAGGARGCDQLVGVSELEAKLEKQSAIDAKQDEDLELLFQTQVRLVTSVEALQREVHEVRKDLRALDAGRPLAPLRQSEQQNAATTQQP